MTELSVTVDMGGAIAMLESVSPSATFAKVVAFSRTAKAVKDAEGSKIATVFDNPTSWTKNAPFAKTATLADQTARSWLKDQGGGGTPAGVYLLPQIEGGNRPLKPFELRFLADGVLRPGEELQPSRGVLDSNGNISRAKVRAAARDLNRVTVGSQRRAARGQADRYFVMRDGLWADGIYQQVGLRITQLLRITKRRSNYRAKYDFHGVADPVIDATLLPTWEEEYDKRMGG